MRTAPSIRHLGIPFISLALVVISSTCQTTRQGSGQEVPVVRVPFVGCSADGQTGPVPAPKGINKVVQIDASAAQKLAYYKDQYTLGVLAPRGWYCFGMYGSSGSTLFVTPQPIKTNDLFSTTWKIIGPGIQVREGNGETSGRFEVAQFIARVFPAERAFVQHVIKEGLMPASAFPLGPFPNDKLAYKSDWMVEYQTPPHSEGLGTMSRLQASDYPVRGVAILKGQMPPDLLFLAVRLPPDISDLTSYIIQDLEKQGKEEATRKETAQKQDAVRKEGEQYTKSQSGSTEYKNGFVGSNGLLAHDINGFSLDMTVEQVAAVAHRPLSPLGGGDYKVTVEGIEYGFGFSVLGHLFRIDSKQPLGHFIPDGDFAATLTNKLSKKFGPPQSNQLPGGPAFWTFLEAYTTNGETLNRETESLSVMLGAGYGEPVSLEMKLMDFRIMRRDIEKLNTNPRSHAQSGIKF